MKKLLITAAAVAGAVAAQAATFSWATGKAYSITADTIAGGLANGHYASATSSNGNTMYNQITSFGATWAYEITFTSGSDTDKISGTFGTGDFVSRAIQVNGLSSGLIKQTDPVTPVNYSIVITGTLKDGKNADWTLTSDAIAGTWDVPSLGDAKFVTAVPAGWTVSGSAVPEPTSGLLMLLGMAGLALRRKRA